MAELDERIGNNADTAYERSDWPLGAIGLILLGIFIILVISPFVLIAAFPTTPADVNRALTVEPPQPRLQTDPSEDFAKFRAGEEQRLNGYYWVDKKKGIVHIPIEQAMKKLANEGVDGYPRGKALRAWLLWLVISASLPIAMRAPRAAAGDDLSEFAFRPHQGAPLPLASEFVDEHGQRALLGQFFAGKPVVLVLDYLRCQTLCGLTLKNLAAALDGLPLDAGRDFQVVVISIDPRDKPTDVEAAKIKYLVGYRHPKANKGWHFLTRQEGTVRTVADAIGFPYRYEAALDQYIHPAGFIVAAADGIISRYLLGVDIRPVSLRTALDDAAQGRAMGLVERLLLLCHGKDPNLGRYSLTIEAVFLIANLMTMAGGVAAFVAIRRRRHG